MARFRLRPPLLVLGFSALVAGALVLAGMGSQRLFERPEAASPTVLRTSRPLFPVPDPGRFRVAGVQGKVECVQGGRVFVLQAGDLLSLQDVLRTPEGGRVLLRRGSSEIEVRENLELRLEALAEQTARFNLLSGAGDVAASVAGAGESVAIAAAETLAVNQGASRWVVARAESGQVAVAVTKGKVAFGSRGQTVTVSGGEESVAPAGQPPAPPEAYPDDLLLSVTWPEALPRQEAVTVEGTAKPASRISVNGRTIEVGPDGRFIAEVPVGPADTEVKVHAEDLLGRRKTVSGILRRRAPAPTLESKPEALWDAP